MIIKLLKFFSGYLRIIIKGYSPERFINLCSNHNILLWNIRKTEKGYEFNVSIKGFYKLRPIVRKTKTKLVIVEKIGLPFFLHKYRKRKIFFGGIIVFSVLIYTMSLFIWDISIEGEYTYTDDLILKFLKQNNIYTGIQKSKISCSDIEFKIRDKYKDIGWVSAEIKGTRLLINLNEILINDNKVSEDKTAHIIANKDGIITSIITRTGTPLVFEGNVVKKGELLISGVVNIIGDNDIQIGKKTVLADGDIYAKTYYNYHEEYKFEHNIKEYTGNEKKKYEITLFTKKITLYNPLIHYEKYDITNEENQLKIGDSFYLPVIFSMANINEYKENQVKYTNNEIELLAKTKLDKFLENLTKKGVQIISNNVTIVVDKKSCIADGKIQVVEKIGKYKNIEDNEWRQETTDEHSGNNN